MMALDVNVLEIPEDTEPANLHAWLYSTNVFFIILDSIYLSATKLENKDK